MYKKYIITMDENKDIQPDEVESTPDEITPARGVKFRNLIDEMQDSYLDYAMSVIVSRALPDVRDGLKPVHRRILYAMHELGLRSTGRYRKSATVVGEVLGKYHPHGDIAVYDSLVRMAQNFSMRETLIDGQGNFGSMDGDSPAAMRYTEARMAKLAEELLVDIEKETVPFSDNYDASRQEPNVLPAKAPNLLVNGSLGIAVGMATNIPTHNLGEICDATIKVIDNPDITIEELMEVVPGPDFPTGATIFDSGSIAQAYTTGKGSIVMRAVADIVEHKNSFQIIITEIPYQVNKSDLILKIADLVRSKKIDGINDLRDESDRKEGVRIVVDLKSNAYPKKILNQLYELTQLQTSFHVNLVALIDGIQPRLLNVHNCLEEFIKHRQTVITLRTQFDLNKAKERLHILEGLKIALDAIDAVIDTIRKSPTKEEAHSALMKKFKLSDLQASAILEMRLSALAGLERQKVEDEIKEKIDLITSLQSILDDPKKILSIIKDELIYIKEKYATPRRTKIIKGTVGKFSIEDLIANEQVIVTLTHGNYIKRVPVASYRNQMRGGKGIIGMETKDEDAVEYLLATFSHNDMLFFTDKGRVFSTKVYELPAVSRTAKGQSIMNILQLAPEEKVTAMIDIDLATKESNKYIFMATTKGTVKKTLVEAYKNIRKTGIIAIGLQGDDQLKFVKYTNGEDNILIVSKLGQAIYFKESDVRPMGRSASGVRGIKLRASDEVISCDFVRPELDQQTDILTVLENGFGKRTTIGKHFHTQKRGGIGIRASKVNTKTGHVVEAIIASDETGDCVIISKQGQVIRLSVKSVKRLGRDTMGVTLMRLKSADKVSSVGIVREVLQDIDIKEVDPTEEKDDISTDELHIENNEDQKEDDADVSDDDLVIEEGVLQDTPLENKVETKKPSQKKKEISSSRVKPNKIVPTKVKKTIKSKNKKSSKDVNYWGSK